jgi:hypothetical protein
MTTTVPATFAPRFAALLPAGARPCSPSGSVIRSATAVRRHAGRPGW